MDTARDITGPAAYPRSAGSRSGVPGLVFLAAILCLGLMAGLFFAFDISVMPGLARTDDRTFVSAMQKINEAIQNPVFGITFVGALLLPGAAAFLQYRRGARVVVRWILAALALYVVALLITMGVNVPLNDKLAAVGDPSGAVNIAAARHDFEGLWEAANVVRTLACTLALVCLGRALSLCGRDHAADLGGG